MLSIYVGRENKFCVRAEFKNMEIKTIDSIHYLNDFLQAVETAILKSKPVNYETILPNGKDFKFLWLNPDVDSDGSPDMDLTINIASSYLEILLALISDDEKLQFPKEDTDGDYNIILDLPAWLVTAISEVTINERFYTNERKEVSFSTPIKIGEEIIALSYLNI